MYLAKPDWYTLLYKNYERVKTRCAILNEDADPVGTDQEACKIVNLDGKVPGENCQIVQGWKRDYVLCSDKGDLGADGP